MFVSGLMAKALFPHGSWGASVFMATSVLLTTSVTGSIAGQAIVRASFLSQPPPLPHEGGGSALPSDGRSEVATSVPRGDLRTDRPIADRAIATNEITPPAPLTHAAHQCKPSTTIQTAPPIAIKTAQGGTTSKSRYRTSE